MMSEEKLMTRDELDILNDYLKTLSALQSSGMKLNNEISLVVKQINKKLGLDKGSINLNANVIVSGKGITITDGHLDLSNISTKDLQEELAKREGVEKIDASYGDIVINYTNGFGEPYSAKLSGNRKVLFC